MDIFQYILIQEKLVNYYVKINLDLGIMYEYTKLDLICISKINDGYIQFYFWIL